MTFKQQVVRILFCVEVLLFFGFYFFGTQGIMALMNLKKELQQQETALQNRAHEIKTLEIEHNAWKNDSFYIEKHAREKLAMARDGEKIYVTRS